MNTLVQESVRSSLQVQLQLDRASLAMTLEEQSKVKMLARTKEILVAKIESAVK